MLRRLASAVALLLIAAVSACSEPDDSSDPGTPEVIARAGLFELYVGDDGTDAETAEGECFADSLLDRLSIAELTEAGIMVSSGAVADDVPPLDPATAAQWVDAQFACSDYIETSTRALAAQSKGRLDRDAYAGCLRGAITDEQLRDAIAATLTGDFARPEVTALATSQSTCAASALPPD